MKILNTLLAVAVLPFCTMQVVGNRRLGINLSTKFQGNPLSPQQVVDAVGRLTEYLGSNTEVECAKFFDFDSSVTDLVTAAADSGQIREIMLGIPNSQLEAFASGSSSLIDDLVNIVQDLNPRIEQFHIAVGNEPYANGVQGSVVASAISTIRNRLGGFPVTIPFSMSVLETSFPTSAGEFKADFVSEYTSAINVIDFFTVNAYPFFNAGQEGISLDTLLGTQMEMLNNQLEAVGVAIDREYPNRGPNFETVLGETGWSSSGNEFATPDNAITYLRNAVAWINDAGRSNSVMARGFIFELVDESLKTGDETERHFGVFDAAGNEKSGVVTTQPPVTTPAPAPTVAAPTSSTSNRRLGINLSTKFQSNPLSVEDVFAATARLQSYLGTDQAIECVKLFDFDDTVADLIAGAAASSQFKEIMVGIPNYQLATFSTQWLNAFQTMMNAYDSDTTTFTVQVSNEPYMNNVNVADIQNTINTLRANFPTLQISVPFSYAIMEASYPVEDGAFFDNFVNAYSNVMASVDFLSINIYPFFALGTDVSVELASSSEMELLSNQLLAYKAALNRAFPELNDKELVIGETGWPSAGNEFATPQNGFTYFQNAARFLEDASRSGDLVSKAYLFEVFDEEFKDGASTEPNFGIFFSNGNSKVGRRQLRSKN